jgi:DNA repair photolyase
MSNKRSLDINWGGFFYNSSIPLHLALNYCSHGCSYCFANLNNPDRRVLFSQVANYINEYQDKETYLGYLMRKRATIDISNLTDPFARNNYQITLPLVELFTNHGFKLSFATRGGFGIDECLDLVKPSVWYVSLPFLNDTIRKKVEPNAPPVGDRLELISKLKKRGHKVLIGINPYVPQWVDTEEIIEVLNGLNIDGIWTQLMHLSNSQKDKLSAIAVKQLSQDVIDKALIYDEENELKLKELRLGISAKNIPQYYNQCAEHSTFFDVYKEVYQDGLPMFQDWVNYCYENHQEGDLIYVGEWLDFWRDKFPNNFGYNLADHINATHIQGSLYGCYLPTQIKSYDELMLVFWQYNDLMFSPCHCDCFAYLGEKDDNNKWTLFLDENDRQPILCFLPNGTNNQRFIDVFN